MQTAGHVFFERHWNGGIVRSSATLRLAVVPAHVRPCLSGISDGLTERDAWLDTADERYDVAPVARRPIQIQRCNGIHLSARCEDSAEVETCRKHTDHGRLMSIHVECFSDDVGIGIKLALPPCIAQQYDRRCAVARIFLPK